MNALLHEYALQFLALASREQVIFDAGWPVLTARGRLEVKLLWPALPPCEQTRIARDWLAVDKLRAAIAGDGGAS